MARGSRYHSKRLVGPATMENLSWIDIAKARLHIGNVVPVPTITLAATGDLSVANHNLPSNIGEGDIVRVLGAAANSVISFDDGTTAIGGAIEVIANSEIYIVIPPLATRYIIATAVIGRLEFTRDD